MALEFFNDLGGMGMSIFSGIFQGLLMGLLLGIAVGAAVYVKYTKKFNYVVRIYEKDTMGNIIEKKSDTAGMVMDKKTSYRLFKLRKNKIGMQPDQVPFILNSKGHKVVHLLQLGLKNFQYLGTPEFSTNPGFVFNVHDEDIAWGINAWERTKLPNKHDLLKQMLPYIGLAVFGMFIFMMLYLVFDKFDVIVEAANAFKEASASLAKASLGTTVIGG